MNKNEYDFIRPTHYHENDGRETWEHMVDKWGKEKTALWCEMTAFKYERRIGKKPGEDEEREKNKIKWYKDKAAELRLNSFCETELSLKESIEKLSRRLSVIEETIFNADNCEHEYPIPWHSVVPPHCKKCGKQGGIYKIDGGTAVPYDYTYETITTFNYNNSDDSEVK